MYESSLLASSTLTLDKPQEKYSCTKRLLEKEIALVFSCVFLAFIHTRFGSINSNSVITFMKFHQWLIEASFAPHAVLSTYYACRVGLSENCTTLQLQSYFIKFPCYMILIPSSP